MERARGRPKREDEVSDIGENEEEKTFRLDLGRSCLDAKARGATKHYRK